MSDIEAIARHLAGSGADQVEKMGRIVDRARAMLADPAALAEPDTLAGPSYAWEAEEQFAPGTPETVYIGSTEDYTTGQGMTVWLFLGKARSEGEFRRHIAREVNRHLAEGAIIGRGPDAQVPYGTLLSGPLRKIGRDAETGGAGPAVTEMMVRCHLNYA